jgi:hypothetical protein
MCRISNWSAWTLNLLDFGLKQASSTKLQTGPLTEILPQTAYLYNNDTDIQYSSTIQNLIWYSEIDQNFLTFIGYYCWHIFRNWLENKMEPENNMEHFIRRQLSFGWMSNTSCLRPKSKRFKVHADQFDILHIIKACDDQYL